MSAKDTGGPAFPQLSNAHGCTTSEDGATLRDYFAAAALRGGLANPNVRGTIGEPTKEAYQYADAMLVERAK